MAQIEDNPIISLASMNEIKIDLMELTADSIIRKVKALHNDPDLTSLSLIVQRKKKTDRNDDTPLLKKKDKSFHESPTDIFQGKAMHYGFLRDERMQKAKRHYNQGMDAAI